MSVPPPLTPDRQQAIDNEHVRLLSIFHFVGAGFAFVALLFLVVHFLVFHTVFTHEAAFSRNQPPFPVFLIFGVFYVIGALWLVASLILNLVAGVCLQKHTHRVFCMVVAGLNCLHMPIGTVLGIFTFVVLNRPSVQESFERVKY